MINRQNWLLTEEYLSTGIKEENPNVTQTSIDRYEFSLKHLLLWADDLPLDVALNSKNPPFTTYVKNLPARRGEGTIALESQKKIILVSKKFLQWAKDNKSNEVKNLASKNIKTLVHPKISSQPTDPISVSLDEVLELTSFDCGDNLSHQRDLAAMAFAFLSGARAGAIASAPIKTINLDDMCFMQYPELGVKTKNGKREQTFLLPIPELISVVKRWDNYVRSNLADTELWYAPLTNHWGKYELSDLPAGANRNHAINDQFGVMYEKAGMKDKYKSPHKYRHGHAVYGISRCKNMAEYQSISRNLMHSNLAITDKIYAVIERDERRNIISKMLPAYQPTVLESDLDNYLRSLCKEDKTRAIHILVDMMSE